MKSEIQSSVRYLLAIAGLGGLLYGIDFGVIAAASPYIKALRLFSDAELSWIVGAVLFGGIVSSLTAGMLAERFGRKRMIVASAALFLVAIPTVCLSEKSLLPMLFGRVLQGVSAGYMAVVMPMYLTETLPPEIRGRGTGVFQFCLGLGLLPRAWTRRGGGDGLCRGAALRRGGCAGGGGRGRSEIGGVEDELLVDARAGRGALPGKPQTSRKPGVDAECKVES